VPCPKLGGTLVRNLGPTVVRMEILPDYIQKPEDQKSEVRGQKSEQKEDKSSEALAKEETQNAVHS
jgi:hypothetical protein